ncbi:MAG: hypothetical protein FWC57_01065, partial [Endomicrobia bacterium]|nr:hypothetical protein [Endomicrobiia bacterium]
MKKKALSLFLAVCMAATSLPSSSFAAAREKFSADSVSSLASITYASFKDSPVSVINIQDLHFNPEAQNKIYGLLEKLGKTYPDMELYVEGASEKSNFDWVFSSLGKKNGELFLEALFKSGNLSGAEYFAAKNNKTVNPLEDKELYTQNLLLFAKLIEKRPETESFVAQDAKRLESLRSKYFSSRQKKLFDVYSKRSSGSIGDSEYFEYLKGECLRSGADLNDYPNISLYAEAYGSAQSASRKKLQAQMSKLFANLKNTLSYKEYSNLISASNNLQDKQALMNYLYKNRRQISLGNYPELDRFAASIALAGRINRVELIGEQDSLFKELSAKNFEDKNSENIMFISMFSEIYKKALTASATADEYEYYKSQISKYKSLMSQYVPENAFKALADTERDAQNFNDTNIKRSEVFVEKMFGQASPEKIYLESVFGVSAGAQAVLSSPSKVSVVIAGGFHTSQINDILGKRQISNVTFTPNILSPSGDYSSRYVEYAKTISNAENSAIQVPGLNEAVFAEFAKRVMDAVYKEKDLLSYDVKKEVEDIISARPELAKGSGAVKKIVSYSYDEQTGRQSAVYIDANDKEQTVYYVPETDSSAVKPGVNLTTLGKLTPAMVRIILRGATFGASDNIYNEFVNLAFYVGFGGSRDEIKEKILDKSFDYDKFFSLNPSKLGEFIAAAMSRTFNVNYAYAELLKTIKNIAVAQLSYYCNGVEVEILPSGSFINEGGYCLAALAANDDKKTATLYIDSAYLETLKGGSKADMENDLKDLIQHELYEQEALFDSKTDIYKAFTSYLNSIKVGEEGRITENFHKFLETEYFKLFMDSHPEAPTTYSGQKGLVKNAEGLQESILTKSYRDYRVRRYVEEIDSFENMDKKLQNDFVMLRLGDESTINEYAEKIENYIRDNDIVPKDEKKKYVIAVRKTEPEHIMQQLAEKVSKNLGIETIFLEQSDYMNYYAVHAHDDISSHKFDLNAKSARDVRGKNVIVLEDILKTGFTLREISKILNGARAQRVIPIAVFDAFYAVKFSKKNEEPAGRTFNANDYIKQFMQTDPQKAAGIIITLKGKTTKYLCYALNALLKEDPAAFFKVIERINADSDTANNMAYELIKIQKLYPQMSSAITPLIFAIVTGTSADKVKISDMPSLLGKIEAKCLKIEDCKGEMFVSQDELDGWGGAAWLIPAAARLSGYTKVKIAARKGVEYDKKQADMLLESAKRLGINAVYEYPFDELKMPEEFFALRQPIEKAASEFKNDMEKVRKKYDEAVLNYAKVQNDPGKNAREKAAAAQERKDAEEKYKKAVKGLLLAVDDLVRSQLPDFPVSRRDYSIVAGGSLAKGSFTSNSDIYYDIIAADEDIAAVLENNGFLQLYHYALSRSGINPYLSNGPKITYPGDIYGGFLENLIKADLSDESAAANFFDFEPAAQDNSPESRERNAAYKNYMEKTGKILLNKDKKGDETVKRDNLADDIAFLINEVSEPYFEMINKGAYNKKNGSVPNTFFGNVYAQAYNDKSEQYDLRWAIRGLDVMLKGILLKNIGKITDISQVPRETTALLAHLYGSGMLAEKNKGEADAIQNAVRTLYVARQQKAAAGKEYSWTAMTKAEEEALKTLKNFTAAHRADMRKLSPVNRERLNKLKEYSGAVSYALGRYSKEQLEKVLDKIRKYEKWSGNKYSPEMSVALLLSEIPYEEISTKVLGLNEGQNASPIMTSLALLRSAGSLPPVTKVKGDFAIQNYMDIILAMARSPQDMYAIFADKLFDVLDSVDEIAAKKAHEPGFKRLLDENKIADYYLGAGISALLDKLKGLDESGIRAFLKPEAAKTDMKELEESLEDSVKAANIIDRQKIIDAIFPENEENNAPFSELAGAKALAEMVKTANSSYFAFLSEAGKKTVSDEKTAAELTMYFVYIPLARRIGRVDVFEDMRNTIFEYAEPDAYLRIRSLLEKYIGGDEDGRYNETAAKYDRYDDNLTLLKTAVEKAMSGKEIAGRVKSRVKSLYSIYEKILSGRRDKSGSKKTKASDITLEDIKENIHDVFGLHVIVNDRNDMDKAKDAIEKLFESGQLKAAGLSLIDPDSGDLARIFDADIQKGFARTRYTFYYKGKQVGELVLYCEHEYQNEHDGLYTIPQNMLNAKDAGNFFIKFPLSHWIYKMGVNVAN